jgi:cytochrome b6-f complex iron-sulfur subunit
LTGAAFVAALAWPVSRYIRPVGKRGQGRQIVSAGQEADWSVWDARTVMIGRDPVAVIHTQQGYQAVSARCTHLGCVVRWDGAKRQLLCPCHGGRFDAGGKVLAGPVPAPLPAYDVAVVDGEVMVSAAAKT